MSSSNQIVAWTDVGWNVKSESEWNEQGVFFDEKMINLYVYDTSSHWVAMCQTRSKDMQHAEKEVEKLTVSGQAKNRLTDSCAQQIGKAADGRADFKSADARKALLTSMFLITGSCRYMTVKDSASAKGGHWLTILYRLRDGSLMTRISFTSIGSQQMDKTELSDWAEWIVGQDLTSDEHVGKAIMSAGGVNISPWR